MFKCYDDSKLIRYLGDNLILTWLLNNKACIKHWYTLGLAAYLLHRWRSFKARCMVFQTTLRLEASITVKRNTVVAHTYSKLFLNQLFLIWHSTLYFYFKDPAVNDGWDREHFEHQTHLHIFEGFADIKVWDLNILVYYILFLSDMWKLHFFQEF